MSNLSISKSPAIIKAQNRGFKSSFSAFVNRAIDRYLCVLDNAKISLTDEEASWLRAYFKKEGYNHARHVESSRIEMLAEFPHELNPHNPPPGLVTKLSSATIGELIAIIEDLGF